MLTRSRMATVAFSAACVLATSAMSQAQPTTSATPDSAGRAAAHRPHGREATLQQLGLSDAQRQQIDALRQQARDEMSRTRETYQQARRALREAMTAEPTDEGRIRDAHSRLAALQADRQVAHARTRAAYRGILTAEQRAQLDALQAARRQARANHVHGSGAERARHGRAQGLPR